MSTTDKQSQLEENKALAQKFHFNIIQKMDLDLADEIIAADCEFHSPLSKTNQLKGPERAKSSARRDKEIYPNGVSFVHDNIVAEGNLVAFHWISSGVKANGEVGGGEGIDIVRIENGKIAETWIQFNLEG